MGVSASVHAGIHTPLGRSLGADTSLGRQPPGRDPPGQTFPGQTPPYPVQAGIDMATAADGMHPTGMHTCFPKCFH